MEQYEQSGPSQSQIKAQDNTLADRMDHLQKQVASQDLLITRLEKEIRRLKDKMDRHADYLNRQDRG